MKMPPKQHRPEKRLRWIEMERYSVLQTVYKSDEPHAFRLSLESMLKQTAMPDEIVLVKDGPVPESLQAVIDEMDSAYPGVIVQVQLEKNVGLGLALNEGLQFFDLLLVFLVLLLDEALHQLAGFVPELVVAHVHLDASVVNIHDVRANVV